ncbi:MAG TPA: phosphotransferase [Acidimicrobiia bacterium]|jgi:aminoglycoside phosphotransferase (APT) family kinase protein/cytochrome P450|nr:phosphotransferase [Acidimicrobiia bacterium]
MSDAPAIDPEPPRAPITFPWDDAAAPDPVAALATARRELGDTFVVDSGSDRYLFVFSPRALEQLYALPERVASKGLADYRMLLRKLPDELFLERRTFAHDLFGAQDVEHYLDHLDVAIARQIEELGDAGTFDAFALARRLGHRLALGCWMGDTAAAPPGLDPLIADLEQLDGAEAFVNPERMAGRDDTKESERAALARLETAVAARLSAGGDNGFLSEIARRWDDVEGDVRTRGITGDVVLLHVATMTNLFAALGWTLCLVLLDPAVHARLVAGTEAGLLDRCALEAVRIGQRSIMMRSVLRACTVDDGATTYALASNVILATMLPLTNTTALPGFDRFDPDRWVGRRLRDEDALGAREVVATFGHGSHRCPATRFSLSAIGRAVDRLVATYELRPRFDGVHPIPSQIGGVARAADPCLVDYVRRTASTTTTTLRDRGGMVMSEEMEEFGTPWRRDLDEIRGALTEWAAENVGADATVVDVASPGNGMSSETVLFAVERDGAREEYAARLAPLPEVYPVFPQYDLELQRRCMDLVRADTDVPAPEVVWYEGDSKWVGTPFLVMRRVHGDAPPDIPPYVFGGWMMDATPEQRQTLQDSSVSVLARLHAITPATHDLAFLAQPDHGTSALDQQLGYQRWYYDWAREGMTYPLIERTFAWLDAHRPDEGPTVFNWGDARIGNILYRDFQPVAVLDWEMATVGPAEIDVAWMVFLHRFFDDLAEKFELPGIPDFMQRDEVKQTYERMTNTLLGPLDWFEVFAALRFAVVSLRTSTRGMAYGIMEKPEDPDDLVMFRTLLERMLDGSYWA